MGILDKKSSTFDEPAVPPVPPAPPTGAIADALRAAANRTQPTDAAIVAELAGALATRLVGLTDRLDARLAAVSAPKDPQEPAPDRPMRNLSAPYFAGVCADLGLLEDDIDRIESLLARLAI